jgi:hypothetical protein
MNFPIVMDEHWVLACVNPLFSTTNFFDSAGTVIEKSEDELMFNLV